jgi:leucyl aminopeptidase
LLAVKIFEGEDTLVGPVAKVDAKLGGMISGVVRRGDFKGKEGQAQLLYPPAGELPIERILLIGIGKREKLDLERIRRAAAVAVKQAIRLGVPSFATIMHHAEMVADRITPAGAARAIAEGVRLGAYVFDEFKSSEKEEPSPRRLERVEILEKVETKANDIRAGVKVGDILARGENLARTLGNLPGNVATPTHLAERAEKIAADHGMKVTVLGREEMRAEGMGALLAVAQGTEEEPRLIVLEHRKGRPDEKPLVLVGKGLTFDSGGISIKPSQGMEEMKFDMCGAAAVLGAMQAIGELDVPINVIGIVPSSENLISGRAFKPGDILKSHLGKTIEVVNTDAEGRLILADALSFAQRFEPAAIVDVATLTGSCVIALGNQASGGMTNDESLLTQIRAAGDRVWQRVWPLPLFDEYRDLIKSDYADIKNSGGRTAGTITAAWFLREFVGKTPWVHLDIAGTAWGDGKLAYQTKGATGAPTRLLVEWVLSRAG